MTDRNRDMFEARLARIRERNAQGGGAVMAGGPGVAGAPMAARAGKAAPRGRVMGPILAVLVVGAAGLGLMIGPLSQGGPADGVTAVQPEAPAATEAAAAEPVSVTSVVTGILTRLEILFTGKDPALAPPPVLADVLPPAPKGWLRVTQAEAADPGLMARLQAEWQAMPPENRVPLDQSAGLGVLDTLVQSAAEQPFDPASPRTRAVYLAGNGEFATVSLHLRPAREAFGPPGDDVAWRMALRREVKADSGGGEIVQSVTLNDIAAFNRTRPEGKSQQSRPIAATTMDEPNSLRLSAALSHRIEMQVTGVLAPVNAGELLAGHDKAAARTLSE